MRKRGIAFKLFAEHEYDEEEKDRKYERRKRLDRRDARREQRRKRRRERNRRFAEYMDEQLEGKSFSSDREAEHFIKSKAKQYVSGFSGVELFLLQVFARWLINKLIDWFTSRKKD